MVDVTAEVAATEPGTYPTVITGEPRVLDAEGNDVTEQFAISIENGYLTIHDTYVLTVRFVDSRYRNSRLTDRKNDLAPAFTGRYAQGESFGPVQAPVIRGYTPEFREIRSGADGMPGHDMTLVIYYEADEDPVSSVITTPDQGADPQNANELTEKAPRPPIGKTIPGQYEIGELESVEDPEVPLAKVAAGYWALVNLILVLLTLLLSILLVIVKSVGRDEGDAAESKTDKTNKWRESEPEDGDKQPVSGWMLLISVLITIISAVVFILTEDLTNTIALVDRWTLLMLLILVIQLLVFLSATRHRKNDGEQNKPQIDNA